MLGKNDAIWLGYFLNAERRLISVDGTVSHFTPWADGEPNNKDDKEDCVGMAGELWDFMWYDHFCHPPKPAFFKKRWWPKGFVCRKDKNEMK